MRFRSGAASRLRAGAAGVFVATLLAFAPPVHAQRIISQAEQTIEVQRGLATLIVLDQNAIRVQMPDTSVASVEVGTTPRELIVRGLAIGTASMFVWDSTATLPRLYRIRVVPDVTSLETQISTLFPAEDIEVATTGNTVIVSGTVRDPAVAGRLIQLAQATGATVIDNLQAPADEQVLLHVRFAEVRKSALSRLGADLFFTNVGEIDQVVGEGATGDIETLAEGIVNLFLSGENASLDAVIRALRSNGEFRSLAEPNLIALDGQQASFLAGGEFPYPSVQTGAGTNAVSIQFKEFGIRLNFTPNVLSSGSIRLQVEPEVSSLDFANGLVFGGFEIPSLVTRRASTTVELRPGQHLAIAGLLDNTMADAVDKIPLLGDLPIIGAFFRNTRNQQDRTELLVLVTPYLVDPSDSPPQLPTGEPTSWQWNRRMRLHADSVGRTMPQRRR